MKYRLNTTNYHDFATFAVNKLPARSYFIPYPGRAAADAVAPKQKRYASPKVQCLNGEWDFKFYPRPDELPVELDTDAVHFDKLDVPSCWQFRGYDKPFYVNIRYQFPYKPPVIPTTGKVSRAFSWLGCDTGIRPQWKVPGEEYNFVGVYRRFIEIDDADKRRIVSFLGVASCMDLYVNGFFIGYSEGAHNTAEFDLTGKLKSGHNELVVVVHRWCNGTYLEDQDMFRNNGIFRDVLLRTEEPTDLWDIDAKTEKKPDGYTLTLSAQTLSDIDVAFTVKGHGLEQTATVTARNGTAQAVFAGLDVTEWNAEVPTLYNIYYETATSCVKEKIGFRTVEIKQDVFLLNGRKIKLKGVNHHDTDAANGYTMSPDDIERDMLVCKRFNIDTVRTSHYPPDPLLLELADELGIYIVDENDLETHGTFAMQLPPTYNSISNDPKWESHYMDRIMRLYQRDKIRGNTSVITTPMPCTITSSSTLPCRCTMRAPSTASARLTMWAARCTPASKWCTMSAKSAANRPGSMTAHISCASTPTPWALAPATPKPTGRKFIITITSWAAACGRWWTMPFCTQTAATPMAATMASGSMTATSAWTVCSTPIAALPQAQSSCALSIAQSVWRMSAAGSLRCSTQRHFRPGVTAWRSAGMTAAKQY